MKKTFLVALLLALSACASLCAQTFSLITAREPVTSLDGLWRFHTGDNPQWADPNFDDSNWPLLRSDEDWARQGYKGYSGYAWYRFRVTVPAGLDDISLLLPPLRTSYQVFVDGKQVGSFGRIATSGVRLGITAVHLPMPAEYRLSLAGPSKPREVTVALRVWHWAGWAAYDGGGPAGGVALAGESRLIDAHFQRLKDSRLLSIGGNYSIGILCCIAGIMAIVLFLVRRKETEYLWFALNQFADAMFFGVRIYSHLYPVSLLSRDASSQILEIVSSLSYILFLQKLLRGRRSLLLSIAIGSVLAPSVIYITLLLGFWPGVGAAVMAQAVCWLVFFVWVCDLLVRRAKEGLPDARLLLAPLLISAALNPVEMALSASFQLGWLSVDFGQLNLFTRPFPVAADDVVEALFLIAMLAILSNRFMRTRREEQRMVTELEAARSVQSLLVPAAAQNTPGFAVESVYLPASEVGGDFFQVLPGADGSLLIVVGDVSGKGLKAAMTVSAMVGALRGCTLREPAEVLAYSNRVLLGQAGEFVTCCATLIAGDGRITVANAGHLAPYLNGEELCVPSGLPLGITAEAAYEETSCQLGPSDRLTYVSDGVVEARSATGELYGFERMQTICGESAQTIAETARKFGQEDDITVLSVTRTAKLEAVSA